MEKIKNDLFKILNAIFNKYPNNIIIADAQAGDPIMHAMGSWWDMTFVTTAQNKNYKILTNEDLQMSDTTNYNVVLFHKLTNKQNRWEVIHEQKHISDFFGTNNQNCDVIFIDIPFAEEEDFSLDILPSWICEFCNEYFK